MNRYVVDGLKEKENSSGQDRLAKGILVNLGGKAIGRTIHILSQVILARILGPNGYGLYGIGWIVFRIGGILSTIGLDSGVIHFASKYWDKDKRKYSEIVISSLISTFVIGCLVGGLIFLGSAGIADAFDKPNLQSVLQLFSIAIPALAAMTVVSAATRVSKDMKKANLIEEIIFPIMTVLTVGVVFLYQGNLEDYVFGSTLAVYISLLAGLFITRSDLLKLKVDWKNVSTHFQTLIQYSLPITLPVLFGTLINLVDRIYTGYFLPDFDTGIYQSVSLVSALFIAVLTAFKTMVAPMMAENHHLGKNTELKTIMKTSTRWVFNICIPILLVVFFVPREIIGTLFGKSYISGSQALIILALTQLINISKGPVDQLLIMTGNQKSWLWITITAFVVNIVLNWIFIPLLGINGAAFSQLFTYVVLAVGGIVIAYRKLGIFAYDRQWLLNFGLAGVVALLIYVGNSIFYLNDLLRLILISCISAVSFLLLLINFGLTPVEKEIFKSYLQNN